MMSDGVGVSHFMRLVVFALPQNPQKPSLEADPG